MPKIRGSYEYDDYELTPGRKKEGGLHQNLFDSSGNLKGSARFIPDDPNAEPDGGRTSYVYVYDQTAPLQTNPVLEAVAQVVSDVVLRLISHGYVNAKPYVRRFWQQRARPAIQSKWESRPRRRKADHQMATTQPPVVEGNAVDSSAEVAAARAAYRRVMSSTEAQARYVLALAAKEFSEHQMRVVANANIEDDVVYNELRRAFSELPPAHVALFIEKFEANPSLLLEAEFHLRKINEVGSTGGDYPLIRDHQDD